MKTDKTTLKSYFKTRKKPTQNQFYDLIDTMVTEQETTELIQNTQPKENTYQELSKLVEKKGLTIGQNYILTDYQTKYYIEGTNSSPITRHETIKSIVSNYSFFTSPLPELTPGTEIEVIALPTNYKGTITLGSKQKVTDNYGEGHYLKFTNDFHTIIDARFKFTKARYSNVLPNTTLYDAYHKEIMKPKGIVNTEVHNGEAYLRMTKEENKAVPFEKILLTAVAENQFSSEAKSLSFPGEILEYDFNDDTVKNEDQEIIAHRNGSIKRRISSDKKIDLDKDWRVQRYRRYKFTKRGWKNYINTNNKNITIYQQGSINTCTISNTKISQSHKYLAPFIENKHFYPDFTQAGNLVNPFINQETTAGTIFYGELMENRDDNHYNQDANVAFFQNSRDYFIFPQEEINEIVSLKINRLKNTIFTNLNGQYNNSNVIDVNCTDGIEYGTFVAGATIISNSGNSTFALSKITAIDTFYLNNKGKINNLNILATSSLNNNGKIKQVTLAGPSSNVTPFGITYLDIHIDELSKIRNTIITGKRVDNVFFKNVQTNKSLLTFTRGQQLKFNDATLYLTALKFRDDFTANQIQLDTVHINPMYNKYGYYFETSQSIAGKKIFKDTKNTLYYTNLEFNSTTETPTISHTKVGTSK